MQTSQHRFRFQIELCAWGGRPIYYPNHIQYKTFPGNCPRASYKENTEIRFWDTELYKTLSIAV